MLVVLLIMPAYFYAMEVQVVRLKNADNLKNQQSDDELIQKWSGSIKQFFKKQFTSFVNFVNEERTFYSDLTLQCQAYSEKAEDKIILLYQTELDSWRSKLLFKTMKQVEPLNDSLKTVTKSCNIVTDHLRIQQKKMVALENKMVTLETVTLFIIRDTVEETIKKFPDLLKVDLSLDKNESLLKKVILEVVRENSDLVKFEVDWDRLKKAEDKIGNLERIIYFQTTIAILLCIYGLYNQYYTT